MLRMSEMKDPDILRLISAVKVNDILWNPTHPMYKDKHERSLVWNKISQSTRIPVDNCRKKWKHLRDTYHRDVKGIWRHRKYLEFLPRRKSVFDSKPESRASSETPAFDDPSDTLQEVPIKYNPLSPQGSPYNSIVLEKAQLSVEYPSLVQNTETQHHASPRKRHNMEDVVISTLETVQELLKRPCHSITSPTPATLTAEKDEDELFCMSVMQTIKKYPNNLKNKAKIGMLRYLNAFEAAHIEQQTT